jgi:L-threonylcarbamoyladenylate synthase
MQREDDIQDAARVLKEGGLILYPTDTVWGIGCDAKNENAIERIYKLKNRQRTKNMIIQVADEVDIMHYTGNAQVKIYDYLKGVCKPTTFIYEQATNLPGNLLNEDGTIGIRIVQDEFCKSLIKSFGGAIVSTSANISGYPPPGRFEDIDILIRQGVDYIVRHRQEEKVPGMPSTVVKINKDGSYEILRR